MWLETMNMVFQIIQRQISLRIIYIYCAPLVGEAFNSDASDVHTYIANFMAGNEVAETKLMPYVSENNGR